MRCWRHPGQPALAPGQRGTVQRSARVKRRPPARSLSDSKTGRRGSAGGTRPMAVTRSHASTSQPSPVALHRSKSTQGTKRRSPDQLTPRQRRIVEEAARTCSDVLVQGWPEAVADRANTYVTEPTWRRLFKGRRKRSCRVLAKLAAAIIDGKTKLHDLVGSIAGRLASFLGAGPIEQQLARELASKIPLPPDAKLTATARGVQITGILLCVVNGDDLTRCQCFIDLALSEAKSRIKRMLVAAADDWIKLADFPPRSGPLSTG